jgi:cytochrome c nitrite reductase small subunit
VWVLRRVRHLAAWAVFCAAAYGQEHANMFQTDPVEEYGSRFLQGVLTIGILLVVFSLLRYRGRIVGSSSMAVLVAGVVVLPSISLLLGTLLVFERAERVEFCASCHLTMQPYVDDLRNPDSNSLAAIHYKKRYIPANQCYDCHTSYGMFGTVEAKMAGMIDVYKYYTRTFQFPIQMRTPYPNNDCLKCHAGAVRWEEIHADNKEALFGGEMVCMACHAEMAPRGGPDDAQTRAHIIPERQ